MFFDVLKISPKITLDTPQAEPGSLIKGRVTVSSRSSEPIEVKRIVIKFHGNCVKRGRISTQHGLGSVRESEMPTGSNRPRDFALALGPVKLGLSHDRDEKCTDANGRKASMHQERNEHQTSLSVDVANYETELQSHPTTFGEGTVILPFSIRVPLEHEGQPLPPTIEADQLKLNVRYCVSANLELGAILSRSDETPVTINVPADSRVHGPTSDRRVVLQRGIPVGTWNKDSMHWWQLLKYMAGYDTAARWTNFKLHATVKPSISPSGGDMCLDDVIELQLERNDSDLPLNIVVDRVSVILDSDSYAMSQARDKMIHSNRERTVLKASRLQFPVEFGEKDTADITPILSGAPLSASDPVSIMLPRIHIENWIRLKLGLRGESPDGSPQAIAETEIEALVRITGPPPSEPEIEPLVAL